MIMLPDMHWLSTMTCTKMRSCSMCRVVLLQWLPVYHEWFVAATASCIFTQRDLNERLIASD
jgi:hypothetical protein